MNGGSAQYEDVDNCAGCSAAFSFSLRKHRCRACDNAFCAKCSSSKRHVSGYPEPVRVCDVCSAAEDRKGDGLDSALMGLTPAEIERHMRHLADMEALNRIYKAKIRPVESAFKFSEFYSSELTDGDFRARPMCLLIGAYSSGKLGDDRKFSGWRLVEMILTTFRTPCRTTFIRYLLERDFPGQRIGPEPTTDRFLAVMHGSRERVVPGNAAAVDTARPFSGLNKYGTSFLNRFEVVEMPCPILSSIILVDTPGILSGEKQRIERGYDFEKVVRWFAERADRVLLLFDAHKLDISDEFKRTIEGLRGHDDKIRVILNKADSVDPQQLMRVYGALMWSLGRVIRTPEVLRVYIGSFWDQPVNPIGALNAELFNAEKQDLLADLRGLTRQSAIRRVNELVKRARLAKCHALLISHLYQKMPYLWGHGSTQKKLIGRLDEIYAKVQKANNLAMGDFPDVEQFRKGLDAFDLSEFPKLSQRQLDVMDLGISRDIPVLMHGIQEGATSAIQSPKEPVTDNPFDLTVDHSSGDPWVIDSATKTASDNLFYKLGASGQPPVLSGAAARPTLLESGLPVATLHKIWELADIDKDGALDSEEFAVCMFLVKSARVSGADSVPSQLTIAHIPPSKR